MDRDPHILVVDDDREIRDLLARFLRGHGMRVTTARDGREMKRDFDEARYALVVLDLMLPGEDGFALMRWVRGRGTTPVVMLTAMGEETDRIVGLELGADDYLPKPFNPRELLARIRAVLRRAEAAGPAMPPASGFSFAGWRLETARRRLLDPYGVEVALTGNEYELLHVMLERPGRVLTRDVLLDLVHGRATGPFDRAVDVAVSRLRRKLDDDGKTPEIIKTVRGGGYVFSVPVERIGELPG
jgi:two-component system OmpR family response regulator